MGSNKKNVAVIGLWHLGCTVAASLANSGYSVTGFDFNKNLIDNLLHAKLPIAEAGLSELTEKMLEAKKLTFSHKFWQLKNFNYIVMAYDTPVGDDDKPNLSVVNRAAAQIAKFAPANATLIIMSQVPAGTCRKIYNRLRKKIKGLAVVYNPENLRLSQAIDTYLNADRQILGISSPVAEARMREFYFFYKNPLLFMSLESAEFVKHATNSFLAMSISFINQLADLSEKFGANINEVIKGLKSDARIGQKAFLSPGLGFGGGTLGRDLRVLESLAKAKRINLPLISDIYKINQQRKQVLYKKLQNFLGDLKTKKIAIFGLVYKPGTNTLRRSLSLEIGKWLARQGALLSGFDPALTESDSPAVLPIKLAKSAYEASGGSDAIIIITEWPEFKNLDYKKIKLALKKPTIFDTKNILSKTEMENLGYKYFGTGV